jgi:hypothetical protein
MSWADDLQARLDEWGKAAFAQELEMGFRRARIFDGKWARIYFDALGQFSTEDLKILGNILPVMNDEFRKSLAERESQLIDAFYEARKAMILSRREKFIEEATLSLREPLRGELVKIKQMAPGLFKEMAKRWDCKIRKVETSVWMLSRLERWGEIFIPLDLHEAGEFSYDISIEDNDYRRVLQRDDYLNRLGLHSKSACQVTSADTFTEKIGKVAEIIEWQLQEYIRIIEPLDWPRPAPFSENP